MVRFLRMCFDWRVLVALVGIGAFVWIVAPDLVLKFLPILLLAACPLSMLFMMRGMQKDHGESHAHHTQAHPEDAPSAPGRDVIPTVEELEARIRALEGELAQRRTEPDAFEASNNR